MSASHFISAILLIPLVFRLLTFYLTTSFWFKYYLPMSVYVCSWRLLVFLSITVFHTLKPSNRKKVWSIDNRFEYLPFS